MEKKVIVIYKQKSEYPCKDTLFRPNERYPEYPFKETALQKNDIYEMVREGLRLYGKDKENFGKSSWNPLKDIISEGDTVLLKPNMVMDINYGDGGVECLYTHPSLVAAMVDYVIIALKGTGKIIIGDAPMQECKFDVLITESGYQELVSFYQKKGIDISLEDFRNVKTNFKAGVHISQEQKKQEENGIIVDLEKDSEFSKLEKKRLENLRVTNYDPRILQQHHNLLHHEYNVSKAVLSADVIINMPKPKTHRKAGVTSALKNLVGINANKEFLPHHAVGSATENGDAYLKKNIFLKIADNIIDEKNKWEKEQKYVQAKMARWLIMGVSKVGRLYNGEKYREGSWYGNDTIWRTILDLNKILIYADKNGKMKETPQRKIFIVGDMIISGEKDGPIKPSPKKVGMIIMSTDAVKFDITVTSIMGFDYRKIPSIVNAKKQKEKYRISDGHEPDIVSNSKHWNGKNVKEILNYKSFHFQANPGWIEERN